ncbi:unnamed protein product, partial [Heligmosomoides polygyrus]
LHPSRCILSCLSQRCRFHLSCHCFVFIRFTYAFHGILRYLSNSPSISDASSDVTHAQLAEAFKNIENIIGILEVVNTSFTNLSFFGPLSRLDTDLEDYGSFCTNPVFLIYCPVLLWVLVGGVAYMEERKCTSYTLTSTLTRECLQHSMELLTETYAM